MCPKFLVETKENRPPVSQFKARRACLRWSHQHWSFMEVEKAKGGHPLFWGSFKAFITPDSFCGVHSAVFLREARRTFESNLKNLGRTLLDASEVEQNNFSRQDPLSAVASSC